MPVRIGTGSSAVDLAALRVGDAEPSKIMLGTGSSAVEVWSAGPPPTVVIDGTSLRESRDQFRQACIDYGTTYDTVTKLPFLLDTSQATDMYFMFHGCLALTSVPDLDTSQATDMYAMFRDCSALTSVPDLDTSNVTRANYMFYGCSSLTDGNVRCIGKKAGVTTTYMIGDSGLTREPFYDANGNPI